MPELLSVRRHLDGHSEAHLRKNMPEIKRRLPKQVSIQWRKFGHTALTLIERGQYLRALEMEGGELASLPPEEIEAIVGEFVKSSLDNKPVRDIKTASTEIFGSRGHQTVAYILDSPQLAKERSRLTGLIDELNSQGNDWRAFRPHLTIASMMRADEERVRTMFEAIRPVTVNLLPIKVQFK